MQKDCHCDMCRQVGALTRARFDAATVAGAWGNLCLLHWSLSCRRALGVGVGQMLILPGEDPRKVAVELKVDDLVVVRPADLRKAVKEKSGGADAA